MGAKIFAIALLFPLFARADAPWSNESELGIANVTGNSETETYNAKETATYQWDSNKLKLDGRYLQSSSRGTTTSKSWDALFRYDRFLNDRFSIFASHGLESDIFAGYVQRNNYDFGLHYDFTKTKPTEWFAEAGYRNTFTQYVTVPAGTDQVAHILRLYTEAKQELTDTSALKLWIEYLPDMKTSENYRINSEASLTSQLSAIFALKAGYLIKYQNRFAPPATTTTDRFFTTSFVAKF